MKKTLILTVATITSIALVAAAGLFALNAGARSHQTCGRVDPAKLRVAADPDFAKTIEKLARCGR